MSKGNRKQTSLGGDAVRLTTSKFISLAITMVTTMLLSRFRTYAEYGTYSQLLLVVNLFTSLFMFGLPNSINFFLSRADTRDDRKKFVSVYYTLSSVLSFFIGLILVLAIPFIEDYFHNSLIHSFAYFLALYPWAHVISNSIENLLVVYKRTRLLMAFRIAHSIMMLGTVALVQFLGFGFNEYMLVFIIANSLFAIIVYTIAAKLSDGIRFSLDKTLIQEVFAFSIPLGLASAIGTLNAEIDKLLIGYLMDTEQLAVYTNAAKELPLTIVATSVTAVLLPQLTRMVKQGSGKEALKLWGYAAEFAVIVIALIVSGVIVYAKEVMIILYSEKYLPGVQVFRIYTLNLLLRCTYFGILLNAYGKTKQIFYCSLVSLGLNIILNPLFYWAFGMMGPAIATFVAIMIIQLLQLKMTAITVGIPFAEVFPWRHITRIVGINIALAGVFYLLKKALPLNMLLGEVIESLLLGVIWSGLYFLIMKKYLLDLWHKLNHTGSNAEL